MPILTLPEAKKALRVDSDHEDMLIQSYADAAQMWIERITGKTFDAPPEDIKQAARMLVAHWYDTRVAASEQAQAAVPFGVRMLVANHRSFVHGAPQ